jgi:hypothetical protein
VKSEWTPRRYTYRLDDQGVLHHADTPITHPRMLKVFFRNLRPLDDGRFLSVCAGEENYLVPDDTPFVVVAIAVNRDREGGVTSVDLTLQDTTNEPLDLGAVSIGENDVVYTRVREGAFAARFGRRAQLALLSLAEERDGAYVLRVGTRERRLGPVEHR